MCLSGCGPPRSTTSISGSCGGCRESQLAFPHIVAGDAAGTVEAVGPAVTGLEPGQRVMVNPGLSCYRCEWCLAGEHSLCETYRLLGEHVPGTAAELLVVPAVNVAMVPDAMGWPEAAALLAGHPHGVAMLVTPGPAASGGDGADLGDRRRRRAAAPPGGQAHRRPRHGHQLVATTSSSAPGPSAPTSRSITPGRTWRRKCGSSPRGGAWTSWWTTSGSRPGSGRSAAWAAGGRLVTCGATTGPMVTTDVRKLFWYQWTLLGSTMGSAASTGT